MASERAGLVEGAIQRLERVSALLADEVRGVPADVPLPVDKRLSKEVLLGISVLLPKLRAVRNFSTLVEPHDHS
jgi:hypothetical protein